MVEPHPDEPPPSGSSNADDAASADTPRSYAHVIATALASAVFALVWYVVYLVLDSLVWENDVVAANWWTYPAIVLAFSLAVGGAVRYLHAPTSMEGSLLDELTGDPANIRWRELPVTVLQSLISLLSGAVVGPEGALGRFAGQIASLYGRRFRVPDALRSRLVFASAASAYNGLLANPLFTAVLGADVQRGAPGVWATIPSNLLGGAIGFAVFQFVGGVGIADFLQLGPIPEVHPRDLLGAVAFAVVGMILAVFGAIVMRLIAALFARLAGYPVARAMAGGAVLATTSVIAPVLLFSGEDEIREILADPAAYGFWLLLALAAAKLALLAVSFKTGFMGGPTFPLIFASICVALAISELLPDLPLVFILAGVLGGALMTVFRTPLMVILLTSFFLGADTDVVAMIVISVVTVVALLPIVQGALEARQAARMAGRR